MSNVSYVAPMFLSSCLLVILKASLSFLWSPSVPQPAPHPDSHQPQWLVVFQSY